MREVTDYLIEDCVNLTARAAVAVYFESPDVTALTKTTKSRSKPLGHATDSRVLQ